MLFFVSCLNDANEEKRQSHENFDRGNIEIVDPPSDFSYLGPILQAPGHLRGPKELLIPIRGAWDENIKLELDSIVDCVRKNTCCRFKIAVIDFMRVDYSNLYSEELLVNTERPDTLRHYQDILIDRLKNYYGESLPKNLNFKKEEFSEMPQFSDDAELNIMGIYSREQYDRIYSDGYAHDDSLFVYLKRSSIPENFVDGEDILHDAWLEKTLASDKEYKKSCDCSVVAVDSL